MAPARAGPSAAPMGRSRSPPRGEPGGAGAPGSAPGAGRPGRRADAGPGADGAATEDEASHRLIGACWRAGRPDEAARVCAEACRLRPGEPRFWEALGDARARLARDLRARGGAEAEVDRLAGEAVAAAYRARDLDPGRAAAHQSLVKHLASARRTAEERQAVQLAIDMGLGLWQHSLQRPEHWLPGLASRPWHDPAAFPWCAHLERNFETIRGELRAALEDGAPWPLVDPGELSLAGGSGAWREVRLQGPRARAGRRRCPATARLLDSVPAAKGLARARAGCGNSIFSKLDAGTHLQAHCGPTNVRLTCHLGVDVPDGCEIRVGAETRRWEEGRCIVFDDSWEHEVWNRGSRPRVVLLVNFWHPDLPAGWHPDQLLRPEKYG